MQAKKRRSLYRLLITIGILFPSFIGILVVQAKAIQSEADASRFVLQIDNTSTATPTGAPTASLTPSPTATPLPELVLPILAGPGSSSLYAFLQAPKGTVPRPYVVLVAQTSFPRTVAVTIRGFLNTQEFLCTQSPCMLDLETSSRLVFAAYADNQESGETVTASISVTQTAEGYLVTIDSISQFTLFHNSCSMIWGEDDREFRTWDDFVQFPYELHTKKTLHTLATQLLLNGIADASTCPAGGLSLGLNWPTACGLERASATMIAWQNQFDDFIWLASRDHGVPPKILKTLIEIESQFWPGNSRFYLDEYGLGQINQLGIDVLLRADPSLFQSVCPGVLSDCTGSYLGLEPDQQAMIRGKLVSLADASCLDCPNRMDLNKTKESIPLVARLLKANCQQVDYILSLPVAPDPDADSARATAIAATLEAGGDPERTTYEDLWRFTLLSYHSGLRCFQDAVTATKKDRLPVTWENVSTALECRGGSDYVDAFMANLFSFDLYLDTSTDFRGGAAPATFVPTRTPVATPTIFVSSATVKVQVFIDRNGNHLADETEWIDAMTVLLETTTNEQISQRTDNGIAIFDMSGYTPGIGINVSLPGLYRNERFELPQQGEVLVTFMFEQPPLPTMIP